MSIKIWEAYRLKPEVDVWEFLRDFRKKAEANAKNELKKLYTALLEDAKTNKDLSKTIDKVLEKKRADKTKPLTLSDIAAYVYLQYLETLKSPYKDFFCFDTELGIRNYKGTWILIPYANGLMRGILKFLRKDSRVEDFHYQNQTDRDPGISDLDWEYRKNFYNEMFDSGSWDDCLSMHIVDAQGFYKIDPWLEMAKQDAKRKKKTPK